MQSGHNGSDHIKSRTSRLIVSRAVETRTFISDISPVFDLQTIIPMNTVVIVVTLRMFCAIVMLKLTSLQRNGETRTCLVL
jgi:hypothetical protein